MDIGERGRELIMLISEGIVAGREDDKGTRVMDEWKRHVGISEQSNRGRFPRECTLFLSLEEGHYEPMRGRQGGTRRKK